MTARIIYVLIIAASVATVARAQDTMEIAGRLNCDCFRDVVRITRDSMQKSNTVEIQWGRSGTSAITPCTQDSVLLASIPDSMRRETSIVKLPSWFNSMGTFSIVRYNDDEIDDLLISVKGKVDSASQDSMLFYLLYGANMVDTVDSIHVTALSTLQTAPFIARQLDTLNGLTEWAVRAPSGRASFFLDKEFTPPALVEHSKILLVRNDNDDVGTGAIVVQPNPTKDLIHFLLPDEFPQGVSNWIVVDDGGAVVTSFASNVQGKPRQVFIDSTFLASGRYSVVVSCGAKVERVSFVVIK